MALTNVRFWSVVLPVARSVLRVVAPVNELVPEKVLLSAKSVVVAPVHPVHEPTVIVPMVAVLERRSVVEARPDTYIEVVVALVVVDLVIESKICAPVKVLAV